jgi:hypothetical protein
MNRGEFQFRENICGSQPRTFRALEKLEIRGTCRIARAHFNMAHGNLGPVRVAWGASTLGDKDAMILAVKEEGAEPTLTLHLTDRPEKD